MNYACGNRTCSDAELDMIEKVRSGGAVVMASDHLVDLSKLEEKLARVLSAAPGSNLDKEELAGIVAQALADRPIELVDTHSYEEHLLACPHCSALEEERFTHQVEQRLPDLAAKYGYQIRVIPPVVDPAVTKVGDGEKAKVDPPADEGKKEDPPDKESGNSFSRFPQSYIREIRCL